MLNGSLTFIATDWSFNSKNLKVFSTLAGGSLRLGEVQPLKISIAARSFNLSGPPKKTEQLAALANSYCSHYLLETNIFDSCTLISQIL